MEARKAIDPFYNRRMARKYTHLKLAIEDRLHDNMLSGEIKVTDARWQAYQTLIEAAEMMSYRYFEKHIENV